MKTYHPISCDFHSELELFAMRQQPVEIRYTADSPKGKAHSERTICETIQDLYTRNGEEFLLLPDGSKIRLDQLVSVGGKVLADYFCG
jgi:Rho-binding antiterminator